MASLRPERHIALVGLPGSGKSTVGQGLARALGRPFLDFDREIETRTGLVVAEIFRRFGEPHFRALEVELTAEILASDQPPMILAPGGGWLAGAGSAHQLRERFRLVYLRIQPAAALARIATSHVVRPLLTGAEPLATLRRLLAERESRYLEADVVLDVDLIDVQEVITILTTSALAWRPETA